MVLVTEEIDAVAVAAALATGAVDAGGALAQVGAGIDALVLAAGLLAGASRRDLAFSAELPAATVPGEAAFSRAAGLPTGATMSGRSAEIDADRGAQIA